MAAIYQWYVGGVTYELYTTTPYPIEAIEGIEFSITLGASELRLIPLDEADIGGSFIGASIYPVLITGGPWDDAADIGGSFVNATIYQILITGGPWDDAVDMVGSFVSANKESKLVLARAPEEGIELSITLSESDCAMTPV